MKKIVNGRVYDTDAAHTITNWNETVPGPGGVKVNVQVRLHRAYCFKEGIAPEDAVTTTSWGGVSIDIDKVDKARGEFFLSYEAGSWDEGARRIVPVTDDEAKGIVEDRCSFDEYVRWFGDPRGAVVMIDAVRKAVDARASKDYDDQRKVEWERDDARRRVEELEARVRELENR